MVIGIATALAVLRTRNVPARAHAAAESEPPRYIVREPERQLEREAA
jgi:hypothetical protein